MVINVRHFIKAFVPTLKRLPTATPLDDVRMVSA
jgi:hypothetical protein